MVYRQIADSYPATVNALNSLLNIARIQLERFHSPDSAKIHLQKLLKSSPSPELKSLACWEIGKCEIMSGNTDSALFYLPTQFPKGNAAFTDDYAQALLLAGKCYFWKGELDSAMAIWENLARIKPMSDPANDALREILLVKETKDSTILGDYASACFLSEQWRLAESISTFKSIITKALSSLIASRSALETADCWVNLSLPDSAISFLESYLKSAPSTRLKDEIFLRLAKIYKVELNDPRQALECYERLLLECPDSPLAPRVRIEL
jgi:tetratricopeptide (TPR) repeat protein